MGDLLGPQPVLLPGDSEAEAELAANENPAIVAAAHPSASVAWAALAEDALADDKAITAYAYARTGYHRGLDQLRRNGWKGFGPVPVPPRTQPRIPALCGRAGAGRRCDRRNRRICAVSGSARRLRPRGPLRTRAELAAHHCASHLQSAAPSGGSTWTVAWASPRAVSTARASSSTRAESRIAGQVRGDHVLAGHQGPHVQVVHLGDALDGAQRGAQLLDVDVAGRRLRQDPQCGAGQRDRARQHPQRHEDGDDHVGVRPVRRHRRRCPRSARRCCRRCRQRPPCRRP